MLHPKIKKSESTGLHDKNGKEIWEGDIIAVPHANRDHTKQEITNFEVILRDGAFTWNGKYARFANFKWVHGDMTCFKVIGNIYENRELLNEDLRLRQEKHFKSIKLAYNKDWTPCKHDECEDCVGTGIKLDGSSCVHYISCNCPKHRIR